MKVLDWNQRRVLVQTAASRLLIYGLICVMGRDADRYGRRTQGDIDGVADILVTTDKGWPMGQWRRRLTTAFWTLSCWTKVLGVPVYSKGLASEEAAAPYVCTKSMSGHKVD
jgi:hypothetical protein